MHPPNTTPDEPEGEVASWASMPEPVSAPRRRASAATAAGRPWHPLVAAIALGTWTCATAFDLVSQRADAAWVYERGALLLTGLGVASAMIASLFGLADLARLPRGTPTFSTGVRHLVLMDVAMVVFATSFALRERSDFAWHAGTAPAPLALSAMGLTIAFGGALLGNRLTYGFGVRVADRSTAAEP